MERRNLLSFVFNENAISGLNIRRNKSIENMSEITLGKQVNLNKLKI